MKGMHSSKAEKPIPGCLGRMVNLFDLSTGVPRNKQLTDKPHRDGSSLSRSQSDVVTMLGSPFGDHHIEDKVIMSAMRISSSNSKINGTPIKVLLDQEMSKEEETKKNPPNVVAKLMGLDAFPRQPPDAAAQRSNASNYEQSTNTRSSVSSGCWNQEHEFLDQRKQHEHHQCPEQNDFKDVYEVWQQPQKTSIGRNKSPQKGRYNGKINEKHMDLVRQKFMEAKRLATDERLRQSKEFDDALEVLSSNKDLFLKFQEPNSLFSQHLNELQSLPPPTETKRITILRPTKMVSNDSFSVLGNKSDKQTNNSSPVCQAVWESQRVDSSTFADQKVDEFSAPPTRIVVLRPTPVKTQDCKAVTRSPNSSSRLQSEDIYKNHEDDEVQGSIEVEEEMMQAARDNLMGHRRDETLHSSVFSNGYTGDESSFHKSEIEYAAGVLSDSEVMSPSPRHSWDYINRFADPFSSSSFSRISCSPESSVCREAKKRLSERWATMALNGNSQPHEQRHARRSSSTLGEMLALSEVKKATPSEDESSHKDQDQRESVSCLISDSSKEMLVDSPSLLRSKSLPVSSAALSNRVSVEDPDHGKVDVPKELNKAKSTKSSLKGKVSSLFFSSNKKSNIEKSEASQANDESQASFSEQINSLVRPRMTSDDASQCSNDGGFEVCSSPAITNIEEKLVAPGNAGENQDQPSPISVLEPPFVEDENTIQEFSRFLKPENLGRSLMSNLIDKSPPIGSIARTLSWDESSTERAKTYSPYLAKSPSVSIRTEEEEQDWHAIVKNLLSAAGLDGELQCDSFFTKWHSLESPLEPSLRDTYANPNDKEPLHEAKKRKWRSSRKLVFDCVNAALVDITGYSSSDSSGVRIVSCSGAHNRCVESDSLLLADRVWSRVKEWFLTDVRCASDEDGDINSWVVERVVKKEVVGRGWPRQMRCEIDIVGKEIEGRLLQELLEEAVVDLPART